MDRFDGKKVIQRQVSDGINKADELVELAMSGNVPVYHSGNASASSQSQNKAGGSVGHKIYTQLMNGVSHMLPFVVGGGILIAIAFLIDGLMVDMNALDVAERSNFGSITPAAAMFKQIGFGLLVRRFTYLCSAKQIIDVGICLLCFRFWRDLLPWQSVTDRHLHLALWVE